MLKRIESIQPVWQRARQGTPDDGDLLTWSRAFLSVTALSLLWGGSLFAFILSTGAVFALHDFTRTSTTKNIEKWLVLSCLSCVASLGSFACIYMSKGLENADFYKAWFYGTAIQKIWGVVLGYYLYRDFKFTPAAPEDEVHFLEIKVTILEGRNLVAKDKNIWGRHTTSDPYVKVFHGPNKMGKTSIIKKTLEPVWKSQYFKLSVVPRALEVYRTVECSIFDHDNLSSDDPMGTVFVPLPVQRNIRPRPEWYPVEKGEGDNYCKNAKGELKVLVEVRAALAMSFKDQIRSKSQRLLKVEK
jgi:hypothetical protein